MDETPVTAENLGGQDTSKVLIPVMLFLSFITVGFALFSRSIFPEYGRLDDYVLVVDSINKSNFMREVFFNSGRWTSALFADLVFPLISKVSRLYILRIISLLALASGATILSLFTVQQCGSRRFPICIVGSTLVGAVVFDVPGGPNGVTWAVQSVLLFALPLALLAGVTATVTAGRLAKFWLPLTLALIFLSAFSYQHWVVICVVPTLMANSVRWARRQGTYWHRSWIMYVASIFSLVMNYLIMRLSGSESINRVFSQGFRENIDWFIHVALPRTINLGVIDASEELMWSSPSVLRSLLFLSICLLMPLLAGFRFAMVSAAALLGWTVCTSVMFPTEIWASYRLLYPSQIALWGGTAFAVVVSVSYMTGVCSKIGNCLIAIFFFLSTWALNVSSDRAYENFAKPNVVDWNVVQCTLAREGPNTVIDALVMSDMRDSVSKLLSYDEYGVIGSSIDWVVPQMYSLTSMGSQRNKDGKPSPRVFPKAAAPGQDGNWLVIADPACQLNKK